MRILVGSDTDGVGVPHQCSLGAAPLLPSIYADARYIDAVVVSKAAPSDGTATVHGLAVATAPDRACGYATRRVCVVRLLADGNRRESRGGCRRRNLAKLDTVRRVVKEDPVWVCCWCDMDGPASRSAPTGCMQALVLIKTRQLE